MRHQFETNVFGLVKVTQAFLPDMKARGEGTIINVSSIGGRFTFPFFGVYNASKYALESMSDALRIELAPFGVHVALVEPGVIATSFAERSLEEVKKYDRPGSAYRWVLDRMGELRAQTDRVAVGPAPVSRAIVRAAEARRPRARTVAPFRYRIFLGVMGALPTRLADWLIARSMGLTRRRRLMASAAAPRGCASTSAG
jgi:short-subunit dehydrogenase